MHNRSHILVWGGYGGGNVGDYITLEQGLRHLSQRYPGAVIRILDLINPILTQSLFPAFPVVSHPALIYQGKSWRQRVPYRLAWQYTHMAARGQGWLPQSLIRLFKQTDLLYCVGGGYFNDVYSLDLFLSPVEWARHLHVPVETAPVGVGPFKTGLPRFLSAFAGCSLTVRDDMSAALVKPYLSVTVQPDDGFAWAEHALAPAITTKTKATTGLPNKPVMQVAVCALHTDNQAFTDWWRHVCPTLSDQLPVPIDWLPFSFDYRPDLEADLMQSIWPDRPVLMPTDQDFRVPVNAITQADAVITGRFHATVMAKALGKPCLAVYTDDYYAQKLMALAEPGVCEVRHFTELTPNLLKAWATKWFVPMSVWHH